MSKEVGESQLTGRELIQETTEKRVLIKQRMQAAEDRQKNYDDRKRKPMEFKIGDRVILKVSPWKGVVRFGKRDDTLQFMEEPVEIMEREIKRLKRRRIPLVKCMSTRSTSSNLLSSLRDPESLIRRRNLGEPSSLFDFEEVMNNNYNNQGPPPAGPSPPQNNNGPPPMATDLGLRHHMIQQVQNSCQFYELPGDDANRHIDKFLEVTEHMKQNRVFVDALRLSLFPYSLTHHAIAWYDRLLRNSIHTFEDMMRKFLSKYCPPSMVTKLRKEIPKFRQELHESLFEAWEHYKLSIDRCHNHNMLLDTSTTRDETSRSISSTTTTESPKVVRQLELMNKNFQEMMRQMQPVKSVDTKCETCGGPHSYTECPAVDGYTQEAVYATTVERKTKVTKDKVQNTSLGSTAHVQPLVVQIPILEPNIALKPKPSIPYPSRLNDQNLREKTNSKMLKFLQIFQRLHFDLSFADALLHIPKFTSMFKSLSSNKDKLFKLANTLLIENCSAVLLKKLPEKHGDPRRFVIPCDFQGFESCMALADLGVSINLMPLSIWKNLSLPDLTSTRLTLELATRTYAHPAGIVEDVFVQVGKFTFPADLVVVEYDVDPCVLLSLGRPFLRTARALVDVYGEELILRDGDEQLIFHDRFPKVLKFKKSNHPSSGSTTPLSDSSPSLTHFETSDSLLEEFADGLALLDPIPPGKEDNNFDFKVDLREIEFLLNQDPSTESNIETIDPILEKFTDEPNLDYLPPPREDDDEDDDLFDLKSDNDEWKKLLYGDCCKDINSEKAKNKDSKVKSLVVEDHIVESNDLLPLLLDNDLNLSMESSESSENAYLSLSLSENKDKVFNPCILILGGTHILKDESKDKDLRDKDLILEDHNFLSISSNKELMSFLELTVIETLLSFSSENEDKDCPDFEDPRAHGFVHRSLELLSLACLSDILNLID
uniref:Reverse transcriptase domain-containing protein n=1 Tax=Tanacetum cinerariifolium TaxID=118510 RepID=A0A6L2LFZ1_TANCI|nr:reverse transcriptase domain-containing protein [Tanacetum cinerariifolium]